MTTPDPTRADRRNRPSGRTYVVGDAEFPSVTNICGVINKPALVPWAANLERLHVVSAAVEAYRIVSAQPQAVEPSAYRSRLEASLGQRAHQRRLDQAGNIGTAAHAIIEQRLRAQLSGSRETRDATTVDPAAIRCADSFMAWQREMGLRPELIEQVVYSRTHQYAGTLDLVATVADEQGVTRRVLIDFKTGARVYAESFLQAAMYTVALGEMGHGLIDAAYIVRLPKDGGEAEPVTVPALDVLWPACAAVITLWRWREDQTR